MTAVLDTSDLIGIFEFIESVIALATQDKDPAAAAVAREFLTLMKVGAERLTRQLDSLESN